MLIEFSVGNFRSIKEVQTLSFVATSIKELEDTNTFEALPNLHLLKSAGIYGANASGKSNLIRAFSAMKVIIFNQITEQNPNNIYHQYFELDVAMKSKPTFLQVVFVVQGKKYRYGFQYQEDKIISEWLFGTAKKNEVYYFIREKQEIKVNEKYFKEGKGFEKNVTEKNLFLSVINFLNGEISKSIINTLQREISIIDDSQIHINIMRKHVKNSLENVSFKTFLDHFLQLADTSILNMQKTKYNDEEYILSQRYILNEKGNYEIKGFILDRFESEGTKKLFDYSLDIYNTLIIGGTLIIDEFDARFHPLLTRKIIQLFNSKANKNNAQLFFATHDTNLLDRELLRRDQIYFAEKDNGGATHIYSLADFKGVRNDASYEKDYIKGKYGAIPFLGDFEQLISNADETTQKN